MPQMCSCQIELKCQWLPQICSPARLEAEVLCLLFAVLLVPNPSIALYNHDAVVKRNCSLGIRAGRHSANLCLQPRAALGLRTALSLSLQPSTSWEVRLPPLSRSRLELHWVMLSLICSHPTFWGTTQKLIIEVNSPISLRKSHFRTVDHWWFYSQECRPFCDGASHETMCL